STHHLSYYLFFLFLFSFLFLFTATSPSYFYTLSLHDALPISSGSLRLERVDLLGVLAHDALDCPDPIAETFFERLVVALECLTGDRKSTRLNSSHLGISYAVFCLKKKKNKKYYLHMIYLVHI